MKCTRCGRDKHRGRCKQHPETMSGPPETPQPARIAAALEVEPGLGFRATVENGQLHIEQDREDEGTVYTHTVTLSRAEAQRLIDWIASHASE